MDLGLSGRLTRATIRSPLTPLILLAALAFGFLALMLIPREEEPQISVPMVDIMVQADGLKGPDAAELVTKPLEQIVKSINGVEHVYSQTQDDRVMVTARFLTGTSEDDAILRIQAKVRANYDRMPLGIPEPLIVGRGINDVAIVTLTLSPRPEATARWNEKDLRQLATKVQAELDKADNVGLTYLAGGGTQEISVEPDPEKLSLYGVTLQQLEAKIKGANRSFLAGQLRQNGRMVQAVGGRTLQGIPDIGLLLVTTRDGRPVYVRDLARTVIGPSPTEQHVWSMNRTANGSWSTGPAVTIAFAKRAGANAVFVSQDLVARADTLKGTLIPPDVRVEITRDYGKTANDKANELLFHLALATISIVLLIGFVIGWREAGVTLIVIPTTILLTLFAAYVMGYTINRVSLFALIFSIGILVDDAIVVIENISRHWGMNDGRDRGGLCRSGQPHHRRHPDRGGGAAAHAVRVRHDGSLYGAYPRQRLRGHAAVLLRRHGDRALGDAEGFRQTTPQAYAGPAWRRAAGGALPAHGSAGRCFPAQRRPLSSLCGGRHDPCLPVIRHQNRHRKAAALRQ
jgi:multidrug efflux pump subunit AcrB